MIKIEITKKMPEGLSEVDKRFWELTDVMVRVYAKEYPVSKTYYKFTYSIIKC